MQRAGAPRQAPGFGAQGVDVGEGSALPRGDRHRVGLVRAAQPLGVGALVGQEFGACVDYESMCCII
ncbi:hypothetical protein, partial [Klebsiella pneumoniae]|uniref:hypothetical protein n=1 Tax=Klebsiella pneumoniae TaxID=573 RepID=UPI00396A6CDF